MADPIGHMVAHKGPCGIGNRRRDPPVQDPAHHGLNRYIYKICRRPLGEYGFVNYLVPLIIRYTEIIHIDSHTLNADPASPPCLPH